MTDISPILRRRWSPRTFDSSFVVTQADIQLLLEAARWAPSARNIQPWRFVVAARGDRNFDTLVQAVQGYSDWAADASALIVNIAIVGKSTAGGEYDLGGAVQHMVLQAQSMGISSRVFVAFDKELITATYELPDDCKPITMTAFGMAAEGCEPANRDRQPISTLLLA